MAHTHDVYDMENHFEINGSSRFIKETSETKLVVVQGDHKSEVLTFKMPRYIDGHDMTLCNKIRIHYINLDTKTNNKSADVYEVTDLTLCEECEDVLTFTWTIEAPATKYSGTLSFLVKFECTEGENVLYQWNTAKYVSVNVLAGIDNSEEFVEKYSNVLEEWYNELTKGADSIEKLNQQAIAEIEIAKEDAKEDIQGKADATMAEMNQFSSNAYNSFKNDVDEKATRTLESIPEDYADLDAEVKRTRKDIGILPIHYGLERTENIFNYMDAVRYKELKNDGTIVDRNDDIYWNTGFLNVSGASSIATNVVCNKVCFYNENKEFISASTSWYKYYTVPQGVKYVIIQLAYNYCTYDNAYMFTVLLNKSLSDVIDFVPYYRANKTELEAINEELQNVDVKFQNVDEELGNINEELKNVDEKFNKMNADKLADYILEEIKSVSSAHAQKDGIFKFAFQTDIHDRKNVSAYKYKILNEFAKTGYLDAIVCGGDCQGVSSKSEYLEVFQKYNKMVTDGINIPYFLCKGNHEAYGGTYSETDMSNVINAQEWFSVGCKCQGVPVVFDSSNPLGGYYYYDYETYKIRMIVLNTSQNYDLDTYFDPVNVIIRQSQIDWLQNEALNFMDKTDREKWSVIIVSHAAMNWDEKGSTGGAIVVEGILNAFMNGTTYSGSIYNEDNVHYVTANCDFTEQGAMEFICNICGHMHYDRITTFDTLNRPCISVGSAVIDNSPVLEDETGASRPTRTEGDITAELLDLVSVDTIGRKIYLTRFGAGEDRETSY